MSLIDREVAAQEAAYHIPGSQPGLRQKMLQAIRALPPVAVPERITTLERELSATREDAERLRKALMQWHKYPDETPPNAYGFGGDSRYLVWTETGDGMAYIGLRSYRLDVSKDADPGCWDWYSGSQKESGKVTHWQSLPQPPALDAARKETK